MFFWWRKWERCLCFLRLLFWVFSVARANSECKKATCQAPLRYSHTSLLILYHAVFNKLGLKPSCWTQCKGQLSAWIMSSSYVGLTTHNLINKGGICRGFCNSSPGAAVLKHLIEQFSHSSLNLFVVLMNENVRTYMYRSHRNTVHCFFSSHFFLYERNMKNSTTVLSCIPSR